jgi:DNA-binding IclR family transcriptional regulator
MAVVKPNATPEALSGAMSSALRCFQVMELLAEAPFELSVSDIAARISTPRASAHRLCATLVESGLVERSPGTKRYRLTAKSLWVGSGYLRHSTIYRAAFFPMQALAKELPGSVQLGVYSEGKVVFIHSVSYSGSFDHFADVGLRRPLHATASGKLFLVEMPLDTVERLMERGLAQIKANGYAVNDEELLPGYFVLAAPVFDANGVTVATISITMAADPKHSERMTSCVAPVCEAARKTSLQLGFSPHSEMSRLKRTIPAFA